MTYKDIQLDRGTQKKLTAALEAMGDTALRNHKDVGMKKVRSARGVPHVIIKIRNNLYSVCWFWQRGFYRVFYPYPSPEHETQQRRDFKTPQELAAFFLAEVNREKADAREATE